MLFHHGVNYCEAEVVAIVGPTSVCESSFVVKENSISIGFSFISMNKWNTEATECLLYIVVTEGLQLLSLSCTAWADLAAWADLGIR